MSSPIIDFHIHLIKYDPPSDSLMGLMEQTYHDMDKYKEIEDYYANSDNFVKMLKENGADYGVILAEYAPLTTGLATHEMVSDFCKGHKELIPFCTINPYMEPYPVRTVKDLILNHGYKGIKLYPTYNHFYPNEQKMYPIYGAAQDLGVPILFHTGSSVFRNARIKYGNPIFFDDVALDFPELKIVMAHGGRGAWYDEATTMIRLHKNVYIDVTGLPVRKLPQFFPDIDRFSHKFVFGTDWPQMVIKESIEKFSQIGLSEESRQRILGGNAARLLNLDI